MGKAKKAVCAICLTGAILFGMGSCNKIWEVHLCGLDEFSIGSSEMEAGLSWHFLPSETFLEDYSYIAGDHYYDDCTLTKGWERLLLWVEYDSEEYQRAKNYCISEMTFREEPLGYCGKYLFYENMDYAEAAYTYDPDSPYQRIYTTSEGKILPYAFTAFSFNDEKGILVFIGFLACFGAWVDGKEEAESYYEQGFEVFMEHYFSIYDFSDE